MRFIARWFMSWRHAVRKSTIFWYVLTQTVRAEAVTRSASARRWDIDLGHSLLIGDTKGDEGLAVVCGLRFLRTDGCGLGQPHIT